MFPRFAIPKFGKSTFAIMAMRIAKHEATIPNVYARYILTTNWSIVVSNLVLRLLSSLKINFETTMVVSNLVLRLLSSLKINFETTQNETTQNETTQNETTGETTGETTMVVSFCKMKLLW